MLTPLSKLTPQTKSDEIRSIAFPNDGEKKKR
ncbi:hypothetical protein CEXT_282501, partial [Caerostris extrusa]